MSSITEAQIVEKPITVATEEAISSFADSRQRRLAEFFRHWKCIDSSGSNEMRPEWLPLP
jgi:hypothetical protein